MKLEKKKTEEINIAKLKKRKWYFRILKKLMKSRYKEPAFIYLGDKITTGGLILSNHEGTDAPMSFEIYHEAPIRMWGAGEMNSGLITLYKYQSRVYYHEKKHWNIHLARLFCLIASPLTYLFYSGLNLISTWHDARFAKTLRESIDAIKEGYNIIVYPEDSAKGYLAELEGFHEGFVMLADVCRRRGIDLPIYVTYFKRAERIYVIDKPVLYSELVKNGASREEIAKRLCQRCNELGKMTFDEKDVQKAHEEQGEQKRSKKIS